MPLAIAATIPGFDHFNERVRGGDGFVLPNSARERSFVTSSERAQFTVAPLPQHPLLPGQLLMMTIRTHDQFNTTIYGLDDRYRGVYGGRRVILMNEADLHSRGLSPNQLVDLTSHFEGNIRTALSACIDGDNAGLADSYAQAVARAAAIPLTEVRAIGTGYGRQRLPFPKDMIRSEILCHGLGANISFPGTATVAPA